MLLYLWVSEVVSAGFFPDAVGNMYDAIGCWEIWLQDAVQFPWHVLVPERFDVCLGNYNNNNNNNRLFPCDTSVFPWHSYKSMPLGQQGDGTARVTLEKINLSYGLGVRQAPHYTWIWVIFWSWVVLFKSYYRKKKSKKHLTWDTLLQNWVWAMIDHSSGSQKDALTTT